MSKPGCDQAKVLTFPHRRNPAVEELMTGLRGVVYSYCNRMSVSEAVGCLEVLKSEILENAQEQE